jgi:flagellar basal-body rod protein FlgB
VANADTPGYKGKDVQKPDFRKVLDASVSALAAARTHPSHLAGNSIVPTVYPMVTRATTDELNPNGNNVSIEEEMQMVAVNAADYQLALGIEMSIDKLFQIALGQQPKAK